jgi:hypothetical protein
MIFQGSVNIWFTAALIAKGITPSIPPKKNRKVPIPYDSMGSGPGNAFFWKKYLQVGDRVKATIDGLGVQPFSIAAEV